MDGSAILTAAEEVLRGTLGSVRTVAPTTIQRDAYAGMSDEQLRMAVLVMTRFEVEAVSLLRSKAVGPVTASIAIHELILRVRYAFSTETELDADERRATRAACLNKIEECRRALTWPGNLAETLALVPTNLIGHALTERGEARIIREDWDTRIFVAEALFIGLINDSLPVV